MVVALRREPLGHPLSLVRVLLCESLFWDTLAVQRYLNENFACCWQEPSFCSLNGKEKHIDHCRRAPWALKLCVLLAQWLFEDRLDPSSLLSAVLVFILLVLWGFTYLEPGARQRWLQWEPDDKAWQELDGVNGIYERWVAVRPV